MPQARAKLDRSEEAQEFVRRILAWRGEVVVLHGAARSGKTEFVRRWIIPALPDGLPGLYGRCDPGVPETVEPAAGGSMSTTDALQSDAVVFLDGFDRLLASPGGMCEHAASELSDGRRATLVLITSDENLGELLSLRAMQPAIMEHLISLGNVSLGEGLRRISGEPDRGRLQYGPELLAAIEADLETFSGGRRLLTPDLVVLIDAHFREVAGYREGAVSLEDFERIGGLRGILETHLEWLLAEAPAALAGEDAAVPRGVIEEVVACRAGRREFDSAEAARRLGASAADAGAALGWLRDQGVIRELRPGSFELAPIHLEEVIADTLEQKRRRTREAREILAQGLASRRKRGVVLAPESFREVHEVRRDLTVTAEQAEFLVLCALQTGEDGSAAAQYWMGRIVERGEQIDAAFAGLFEAAPGVRAGAAALLAPFDEPEVRAQLYRTAVEDSDEVVRRAAVRALRGMTVDEFWTPISNDALLPLSRYRAAAVEALELFPEPRGVALLAGLIADRETPVEIRAAAIQTLAAMPCAGAVDALVGIGLHDEDEADRESAARALATSGSTIRDERSPDGSGEPAGPGRACAAAAVEALWRASIAPARRAAPARGAGWWARKTLAVPVAVGIGIGNLLLHGVALLAMRRLGSGLAILALQIAVVASAIWDAGPPEVRLLLAGTLAASLWWPVRLLMRDRVRLEIQFGTLRGNLLLVLYLESVVSLFFLFHGLAHWFAGHRSRAWQLLGLQFLSLGCFGLYSVDGRAYEMTRVGPFYLWMGVALWAGTWLYDVAVVGRRDLIGAEGEFARRRRHAMYEHLLRNPAAVARMVDFAGSNDRAQRRWASTVLERHNESIPADFWVEVLKRRGTETPRFVDDALCHAQREEVIRAIHEHWADAVPAIRRRIVAILARSPSQCSLQYLRKLRDELGFAGRARHAAAEVMFRLRLVPSFVLVGIGLLVPMGASLAYHGLEYGRSPSRLFLDFVTSEAAQEREPERVLQFSRFLAEVRPGEVTTGVASGLGRIARAEAEVGRWEIRIPALELLAVVARQSDKPVADAARREAEQQFEDVGRLLSSPHFERPSDLDTRRRLLGILEQFGTPAAVKTLATFVERGGNALDPDRAEAVGVGTLEQTSIPGLQSEAVRSLARICTPESLQALGVLRKSRSLAANRESVPAILLDSVRGLYGSGDYDRVLAQGQQMLTLLPVPDDRAARAELLVLLGKAKWNLSLTAGAASARAETLDREAAAYLEQAAALRPLDAVDGRTLASTYVRMARRLIPGDPAGALAKSEIALRSEPDSVEALAVKGQALMNRGDPEGAIAALRKATRINPAYAWAFALQTQIRLRQRRFSDAVRLANEAIQADPGYAWSYALLGESYHGLNQDREAIACFGKLREKYPGNALPVLAQMYVYHEQLAAQDPSAYARNYELYVELQRDIYRPSISKPDDVEAGFVEANLTTGRLAEAARLGLRLLESKQEHSDTALTIPVRAIVFAALALSGDRAGAKQQLEELRSATREAPESAKGEWSYRGTTAYVRSSKAPAALRDAIASLIAALQENPASVPDSVFESTRQALAQRQ